MATENLSWGYTRIQRVEESGSSPGAVDDCDDSQGAGNATQSAATDVLADLCASAWRALTAAAFFTTEVWTARGLITYYTVFVINRTPGASTSSARRRIRTRRFMQQIARHLTDTTDGELKRQRVLICDRDSNWSTGVRDVIEMSGTRVIRTPFRAAELQRACRAIYSVHHGGGLDRLIPLGERHFRRTLAEFVAHYRRERNHQGLGNELIEGVREADCC